jgi:Helix-turn-helix domain
VAAAFTDELVEQGFRYALAPLGTQQPVLNSWLGASRYWFNTGLGEVKERLDRRAAGEENVDLPWSYKGLCSVFDAAWRNERAPWLISLRSRRKRRVGWDS